MTQTQKKEKIKIFLNESKQADKSSQPARVQFMVEEKDLLFSLCGGGMLDGYEIALKRNNEIIDASVKPATEAMIYQFIADGEFTISSISNIFYGGDNPTIDVYEKAIGFLDTLQDILQRTYVTEEEYSKIKDCLNYRQKIAAHEVTEEVAKRLVPSSGMSINEWREKKIASIIGRQLNWPQLFGVKTEEGPKMVQVEIQFIDEYLDAHIDELYTGNFGAKTPTRYETCHYPATIDNADILDEFKSRYKGIYAEYAPVMICSRYEYQIDTYEYRGTKYDIKKFL